MGRHYIAFDIETAKIIDGPVGDLKSHRPLGITCAATFSSNEDEPRTWHGKTAEGTPSPQMTTEEVGELVRFLVEAGSNGATILTWNGLGFDFDILAEESGMPEECKQLARHHVDMMFHVFCQLGYPIGLGKAAEGMGLPGKSSNEAQKLAPDMWADGRYDEILEYVAQDARATLAIGQACEERGEICWITRKGYPTWKPLPDGWLTVTQAQALPEPDTSWMDDPMKRDRFTDWL